MANLFLASFWKKRQEKRDFLRNKFSAYDNREFAKEYLSSKKIAVTDIYFSGCGLSTESYCCITFTHKGKKYETEIYTGSPADGEFSSDLRRLRPKFRFRLFWGMFKIR